MAEHAFPSIKPLSEFVRSPVFPFVQQFEREHGRLQIYDRLLKPRMSDEELQADLLASIGPLLEDIYGSRAAAEVGVRDFKAAELLDVIYQPSSLRWAYAMSRLMLGDRFREVADLFVVPVSVPLFNASATAWGADATVILFHHVLVQQLQYFAICLHQAETAAFEQKPADIARCRMEFEQILSYTMNPALGPDPYEPRWDFKSLRIGSTLSCLQVLFVLLHEYAHVLLGHLDHASGDMRAVRFYTPSQKDELDADEAAAQWLLSIPFARLVEHDDAYNGPLAWANPGVEALVPMAVSQLFSVFHAAEIASGESDSHPPAVDRLAAFLDVLERAPYYAETVQAVLPSALFQVDFVEWYPNGAG